MWAISVERCNLTITGIPIIIPWSLSGHNTLGGVPIISAGVWHCGTSLLNIHIVNPRLTKLLLKCQWLFSQSWFNTSSKSLAWDKNTCERGMSEVWHLLYLNWSSLKYDASFFDFCITVLLWSTKDYHKNISIYDCLVWLKCISSLSHQLRQMSYGIRHAN